MEKPVWLKDISAPVFLLVIVFAMSSWIDVYGLYVELPIFIKKLPEGWALPSQLKMTVEIGNIGPLIFIIAVKLWPNKVKEWPFILTIIGIGSIMCLCLIFFWDKTVHIAGHDRSVGLLTIISVLSVVDCTSSVVYVPYLASYKSQYITAYYIGEGMGSLIPGLLGLAQGLGSEPHCVNSTTDTQNILLGENHTKWTVEAVYDPPVFSVEIFFLFLLGILVCSGIAFIILHTSAFCKKEHERAKPDCKKDTLAGDSELDQLNEKGEGCKRTDCSDDLSISTNTTDTTRICILCLIFDVCLCMVGYCVLPSITSYSIIPYGMYCFFFIIAPRWLYIYCL